MYQMSRAAGVVGFWICMGLCRLSFAAETPRIVVVSSQQGGPMIQPQVAKFIEKPLKKTTTVVAFPLYYKAARAAGFQGSAVFGPEAAVSAGHGANATHVLIITSAPDSALGKHSKAKAVADVVLIAAKTGESLFAHKYPLAKNRLSSSLGAQIVAAVNEHLAPQSTPSATPVTQAAVEPAPPQVIMAPPDNRLPPDLDGGGAVPAPTVETSKEASKSAPEGGPFPAPAETSPAVQEVTPPVPTHVAPHPKPAVVHIPKKPLTPEELDKLKKHQRAGFSFALGPLIYWRRATLDAGKDAQTPFYGPSTGQSSPTFSRLALRFDLYPASWASQGRWWGGFGVHVDGSVGWPKTKIADGTVESHASGQILADVQYRWVPWAATYGPEFLLGLGFASYSFPLSHAVFPGLGFRSMTIDLGTTIPFGTPAIAAVFRMDLMPYLTGFGGAQTLGTKQDGGGFGIHLETGLKAQMWHHLDLQALFNLDQFGLVYAGESRLENTNNGEQWSNIAVNDRILGLMLLVGFSL